LSHGVTKGSGVDGEEGNSRVDGGVVVGFNGDDDALDLMGLLCDEEGSAMMDR